MSIRLDKTKISPVFDRKIKLTLQQRKEIIEDAIHSQRWLATKYRVSRRLITFIKDPAKLQRAKELYKERRKDNRYYDKERHTKAIRETRKYKRKLIKERKIKLWTPTEPKHAVS